MENWSNAKNKVAGNVFQPQYSITPTLQFFPALHHSNTPVFPNTPVLHNLNLLKCKIYKSENNG